MLKEIALMMPLLFPVEHENKEITPSSIPTVDRAVQMQAVCLPPAKPKVTVKVEKETRIVYKEKIVYKERETEKVLGTEVGKNIGSETIRKTVKTVKESTPKVPQTAMNMEFTAYSSIPTEAQSQYYNGKALTATGIDVTNTHTYQGMRIIAVNPAVIPYGSVLNVAVGGQSFKAIALDTGGAIRARSDLVDLMVSNHDEAISFGRQTGSVTYIRKGW